MKCPFFIYFDIYTHIIEKWMFFFFKLTMPCGVVVIFNFQNERIGLLKKLISILLIVTVMMSVSIVGSVTTSAASSDTITVTQARMDKKEGYVPSGCSYERNDTVYTVTVTKNHTTTAPLVLRVSDTPKTCYGKIVKASTKPELTNGNPDYSMEGIRYSFSKSNTDFSPQGTNYIGYAELNPCFSRTARDDKRRYRYRLR